MRLTSLPRSLSWPSARGKISDMVMRKSQAFYGATTETFPPLGEAFLMHFAHRLLSHRVSAEQMPHVDQLMRAFEILGRRPEDLRKAIRDALIRPEKDLGEAIIAAAYEQREAILSGLRNELSVLSDLQRAILKRMVEQGDEAQPFSKESIDYYRKETGTARVSSQSVQKAVDNLMTRGYLWRAARGVYALDDTMIAEFFDDGLAADTLLQALEKSGEEKIQ